MPDTMVDSNVLLDVFNQDPQWSAWSSTAIMEAAEKGMLVINAIIYAELSLNFDRIEELDAALPPEQIERRAIPWDAAFLAGRCFLDYRRRGGAKTSPLPDFFIGAHAAVEGLPLLTRDATRYRTYFPRLKIICPP